MAFRVPTYAPQRQQQSYPTATTSRPTPLNVPSRDQEDDESKEWVLFSPSQTASTDFTHTSSTERTPRTAAALSRFSDFGSLETAARSLGEDEEDEEQEDDGTELDSLDDGLPAFREPAGLNNSRPSSRRMGQSDPAVLPTHDGLGTFQASSQPVQDQLWQHELNNPRRRHEGRHRRRSSVQRQLNTVNELEGRNLDHDRWQRIEKWRMEQSRALLHEIEKETRRRRNSRASVMSERSVARQNSVDAVEKDRSKADVVDTNQHATHVTTPVPEAQDDVEEDEPFWRRITRKVIRELIGIDDSLLSVILGESLMPDQDGQNKGDGNSNPLDTDQMMSDLDATTHQGEAWQDKLLERIARELGILVHQICEHPGAFSTYLRSSSGGANEYAGIPVTNPSRPASSVSRPPQPSRATSHDGSNAISSTHSPHFFPTLQDTATSDQAALWGIEEEQDHPLNPLLSPLPATMRNATGATPDAPPESTRLKHEREYWERELDINMVFQYLRNRFGSEKANTAPSTTTRTSRHSQQPSVNNNNTNTTQQDLSHRAAIIRQHHPLVARAHARSQTQFQRQLQLRANNPSGHGSTPLISPSSPIRHRPMRRASSSCASQSSKVSVSTSRTLGVAGSGSSRNYWDLGGSVGSGRHGHGAGGGTAGAAVVAVGGGSLAGGVGSWGEV